MNCRQRHCLDPVDLLYSKESAHKYWHSIGDFVLKKGGKTEEREKEKNTKPFDNKNHPHLWIFQHYYS